MRMLFVDDSGTPTPRRADWDIGVYILAGVAVDDRDLAGVARAASAAKAALTLSKDSAAWEVHAYSIWNNAGPFGVKGNAIALSQKLEVFSSMVGILTNPAVRIVPVVVDKLCRGPRTSRRATLTRAWSAMFRRFEAMLHPSEGECGLILADEGRKDDEGVARTTVRDMARARMVREDGYAGIVDGVINKDSRLDIMIQMADVAAYVIHRYYRGDLAFREWFESMSPNFDANPTLLRPWEGGGRVRRQASKPPPC